MFAVLALLFLVVPFVELFVLIQVGQAIGALPTIAILVADSVLGAWLVKRQGLAVLGQARQQVQIGRVPGRELIDAALVLSAGALMLTPGFFTDLLGFALLVPPVRGFLRSVASAWLARRVAIRLERF